MSDLALPVIVEPGELAQLLGRDDLLVVDLCDWKALQKLVRARQCVPGAVHLDPARMLAARPPVMGLVPDERRLGDILSSIGLTPAKHVVAYDNLGNANACRFLWILDLVGHSRFSLLNGGIDEWLREGNRSERSFREPPPSDFQANHATDPIADSAYVLAHLDDPSVVLLDSRSQAEFAGGHIPNAINLEWSLAVDGARNMRLRPEAELRQLFEARGVTPDKEVVTYCAVHLRSAHTYVVLKALGYPRIRGYPGSWSEWSNTPDLPTER